MSTVTEGPLVKFDDGDEGDVKSSDRPFSLRLEWELRGLGCSIRFQQRTDRNIRIRVDGDWKQFNLRRCEPEVLAQAIIARCGFDLIFSDMWIPDRGVECVEISQSGSVWARRLIIYDVATDGLKQRWDVLVRAAT